MKNTQDLRRRLLVLWGKIDKGDVSPAEVRVQVSMARTILDSLKVEIAAAHLAGQADFVPVAFEDAPRIARRTQ